MSVLYKKMKMSTPAPNIVVPDTEHINILLKENMLAFKMINDI